MDIKVFTEDGALELAEKLLQNDKDIKEELEQKGYATESFVTEKIAQAQLSGGEVDLSGYASKEDLDDYALKSEIPSLDGYAKTEDIPDEYDDTALSNRITTVENDYLKSSDKTELTQAIATAKTETIETILGETVDADFDTLQEVADWIQADTTASAELVVRVTDAESDIATIQNDYLKVVDKTELLSSISTNTTAISKNTTDIAKNATAIEENTEAIADNTTAIAVERARIDAFTALTEGSTTGDAELIDGRTKADGSTATNIGNAIREQYNTLDDKIDESVRQLSSEIANVEYVVGALALTWEIGAFGADGVTPSTNNKRLRVKEFIDVDLIKSISVKSGYEFKLYFFDSVYNLLGYDGNYWYTTITHTDIKNKYNSTKYVHIVLKHSDAVMTLSESENMSFSYSEHTLNGKVDKLLEVVEVPSNLISPSLGTLFTFDETFTHSNPINIYDTGYAYTTDFNIKSMKKAENGVVYISPNGSDSNDGTKEKPYFTLAKCLESGANTIHFADGVYYLLTNFDQNMVISRELNFIADNEAVIYFGGATAKMLFATGKMTISKSCYFENITFYGGAGLIAKSENDLCAFNNCKFVHSTQNGLNLMGKGVYLYKCEASDNWLDGFNYHLDGDIMPTGCVEIECKGFRNGNTKNRSSNGSTVHDDGRIIRLNCEYGDCHGGIVADSDSLSYNFGVYAHNSTNNVKDEEQYNSNFYVLSASTMWLYGCVGGGSRYMLGLVARSTIHTDTDYSSDLIYNDGTATVNVIS